MRVLFIALLLIIGCAKKKVSIDKLELLSLATAGDPKAQFVIPEKIDGGVKCHLYGPLCIGAHKMRIKGVDFIVVEYPTKDEAEKEAIKRNEYFVMNWLLDEITGEPVLEAFVKTHMNYKGPHSK